MLSPGVTIYFVRHGETDWNAAQRYQGQRDIPLNARGRGQARRNGLVLAELLGNDAASFDYIASPLARACETMEIMRRELSLPIADYRKDARLSRNPLRPLGGRTPARSPSRRSGGLLRAHGRLLELAADRR